LTKFDYHVVGVWFSVQLKKRNHNHEEIGSLFTTGLPSVRQQLSNPEYEWYEQFWYAPGRWLAGIIFM
jgi:hypothetical protein